MGQEDPPARRARPSGASAETPYGASYNVETDRMPDEHQLFSRRRIDREVAVGLGVGRIAQRHGSKLVETEISLFLYIVLLICMVLYVWLYVQFYVDIYIFLYTLVLNSIVLVKSVSE